MDRLAEIEEVKRLREGIGQIGQIGRLASGWECGNIETCSHEVCQAALEAHLGCLNLLQGLTDGDQRTSESTQQQRQTD